MISIDDLILYENENSALDFKKTVYQKENFHELLLDVLAFANAHNEGDKYIILGVKHTNSNERELVGINATALSDQSTYQQLVNSNIEPDINLECFLHSYDNKQYGVFRIVNPSDKPYVLKKDYGKLKKGTALIRKGTLKMPLSRADLDKIYNTKNSIESFEGTIQIELSKTESINNNQIVVQPLAELPSDRARAKIERIIAVKRKEVNNETARIVIPPIPKFIFDSPTPYENRTLETLEENLKSVRETYFDDDMFELSSKHSQKININLLNKGNQYLEDCTVQLFFPKLEELFLLDKIYKEPQPEPSVITPSYLSIVANSASYDDIHYPDFSKREDCYFFESNIGDLKHNLPTEVFSVPLRLVFIGVSASKEFTIKIKIFGKNLVESIEDELKVTLLQST
ncbi:ATP-binding protein [uncultured Maribacter sp.]|uniref:AlbA family DNA-binding domain-containing protein n=1 Tax=uncultured Maribacter sp. TaxID=431308 RepID=UPI0030DAF69C|tara:strand:- start:3208 stop:4410 length:1203 start_codon:yes stop_codon:yes gene_type:complete